MTTQQTTLQNGQAYGTIRTAINAMLGELYTLMGGKADASALAGKADASALASKADVTALAAKADASALAAKADAASVNTALSAKADALATSTALGLKADASAMATALAAKAPLSPVQQTQVSGGATTAVLNAAKTALKDPAGGADIPFASVAVKTINTLQPDASGNFNVTPASIGAEAQWILWNLDTNLATNPDGSTYTPANSTFPTSGFSSLICQGTGANTRTLDGQVFHPGDMAVMSPAIGTWTQVTAAGVGHVSVLVPSSSYTGSTAESATQLSLALATGTLVPGTKFDVVIGYSCSGTNDTLTMRAYYNGTASPASGFVNNAYNQAGCLRLVITVLSATSIYVRAEYDKDTVSAVKTFGTVAVVSNAGLTLGITLANSTTTKTSSVVFGDARVFAA